ncbi:MAG TPA: terminase small subunit [Burkholderiales bacterium]
MTVSPEALVSESELAALVGVSARMIRKYVEQGILERAAPAKYSLGASLRALIENAADNSSELQRERTRKVRADANRAELAYAQAKKLVAPIEDMEAAMRNAFATIRTNMLAVPARVVNLIIRCDDESRVKEILRKEISAALGAVAETEIDLAAGVQLPDEEIPDDNYDD